MAEDVILSVKNISKSFGNLQVLKEISFDIHKGKRLQSLVLAVLVNPQFSGVSTAGNLRQRRNRLYGKTCEFRSGTA